MRIFRHHDDVPDSAKGAVVAIGNFDGVHRGHQALIAQAKALASGDGAALGVLAFEPHPQEFFRPSKDSFRLTPFRAKARLLAANSVDAMFALPFDAEMAARSAEDFVAQVLVDGLGAAAIVVGNDFQFGKGRAGNVDMLKRFSVECGFDVKIIEPVLEDSGEKISSTHIREALKAGKPDVAAKLLGHCWSVEARVEHGDARGRTIGFPTANMRLADCLHPAFGVYAVRATIYEDDKVVSRHDGVANFGIRPMYKIDEPLLETYLFDFNGDLYGKHLAIEFVHYIRGEAKLDGLEALKAQIARDSDDARRALAKA